MTNELAEARVVAPLVHLNGSGRQELSTQFKTQYELLDGLIGYMIVHPPHMRDYYPLADATAVYRKAYEAHAARIKDLQVMRRDIYNLRLAVEDQ